MMRIALVPTVWKKVDVVELVHLHGRRDSYS